jgi:acyl carrier protein
MSSDELRTIVVGIFAEILELPPTAIADDADFFELGGNSLGKVELLTALERRLDVRFRLDREAEMNSVSRILEVLATDARP